MIEHLGDVGADREERVPERDGEVDHGEDDHADRDVGDRRAADAQARRDPRGASVPHANEEGEDARERASDGVDEEGEVDEDVVAAGVVDPEIEDADETVDDEGDQHHLAVSQRERERGYEDHEMDGHDLLGVLDAQHHPNHQSEQIRETHPAEERQAVVLRRGQVAVHVLGRHHAAQTRVRSDRRVAASNSERHG